LKELVPAHTRMIVGRDGETEKARVDWNAVGSELKRVPVNCMNKWGRMTNYSAHNK